MNKRLDVYYNSACPVCRTGINMQKGKPTSCTIDWKDVHIDNQLANDIGQQLEYVRKYLHIVDEKGNQHIGINAFIQLWQNSPTEQWKANVISLTLIKQIMQCAYYLFANSLYFWNRVRKNW